MLSPSVPLKGAVRRPSRPPAPVLAFLAVSFLVLAPAVAWVLISVFGGAVKNASPLPVAPGAAAPAAIGNLEAPAGPARRDAELDPEIRKLLAEYREELRSDKSRKAELEARVAELEAELGRLRSKGGDSAPAGGKVVPASLESPRAGTIPVGAVEAPDPAAVKTTAAARTVVPPSVPGAKLSLREISDLVEALCRRIDEYATLAVTPSSLEPELAKLATAPGKAASEGVLRVDDHLRRLLRSTRAASEENRRRKEALLARSREDERSGKPPAGAESKKEGGYGSRPVGDGVERDQRLLELSEKAMEIQEKQTRSLLRLREAVLSALGRKSDPESVAYLRFSFTYESDADLCRAILPVFQSAGSRDCIPTLYHKLSGARDPALKEAIHRTLIHLAGRDLGDTTGPWAEWWVREGKKELER